MSNAEMKLSGSSMAQLTQEEVRMIANPIYARLGPYPQLIPDEQWVRCSAKAIAEDGPEQFLVNMVHVLTLHPQSSPKVIVPKQISETRKPLLPRSL